MAVLVAKGGRERYTCSKCGKDIPKRMRHYREGSSPNFTRFHVDCLKTKRSGKGKAGKPGTFKVMMSTGQPTFVRAADKGDAREQVKLAVANDTLEGSVVSVAEVTPADVAQYPGILSKREKVMFNPGAQYHALEFDKAHAQHRLTGEAYDSGMADAHRESFRRSIGLHMPNPKRKASHRPVKSFLPLVVLGALGWLVYKYR